MGRLASGIRSAVSGLATPEKWVVDWFQGGTETDSGIRVDEETALTYAPFFAGVRVIAEDLGSLPLFLYERLEPRGKRRASDHRLYELLHDQPNEYMTAATFRETLQGHALTWHGGAAYIERDRGEVVGLWPLRPDRLKPEVDRHGTTPGKARLRYIYDDPVNGIHAVLLPDEVLYVPGLGFDGFRGYSIVSMARNSVGLGLATEKHGSRFFRDGAHPGGVLVHPNRVSPDAKTRMRTDWENLHRGLDRAHRVAILEEGVDWKQIGISHDDAQFLETRKLQVTEAVRWLRVPAHKINDLEHATYSNIEHQALDYVVSSLRPWLVRWEQSIRARVLNSEERRRYFAEHLVDGLLRGDVKTRAEALAIQRQWGVINADDWNEIENRNPLPDGQGEVYLVPLNMVPVPQLQDLDRAALPSGSGGRELRTAEYRRRIAARFVPLFVDVDERIAKMEQAEVGSLVRRHLDRGRGVGDFETALDSLYEDTILPRAVDRWTPVMTALAIEAGRDAADDIEWDGDVDELLTPFMATYTASHTAYRIGASKRTIRGAVLDALDAGEDAGDAVRAVLDEFVADRPARTARWETNQVPQAAARETWRVAGVRELRWRAFGDTCPYCLDLDGRVVGIDSTFLSAGDSFEPDGADHPLNLDRDVFHPPAHPGCDCAIEPA